MALSSKPARAAVRGGAADLCSILGKLNHVVHHHALRRGDRRLCVVRLKRFNQCFIEGDATQKLCVGLDSINTPIGHGPMVVMISCWRRLSGSSGDMRAPKVAKAW